MSTGISRRQTLYGAAGLMICGPAAAQTPPARNAAPIRVLASTGVRSVLERLQADAERALARPVAIRFGASRVLQASIEAGEPFEVAIVTPEVIEAGVAKGALRPNSRQDLAVTMPAIAQRGGGAPRPISAPAALKATLLGARAIRYNPIGSGRPSIDRMWAGLEVDPKSLGDRILPLPSATSPPLTLGENEYELTIVLDSEVASLVPGAFNLGPIPPPFGVPVVMSAAIGAKGDPDAAQSLIDFLKRPEVTRVLETARMKRPQRTR